MRPDSRRTNRYNLADNFLSHVEVTRPLPGLIKFWLIIGAPPHVRPIVPVEVRITTMDYAASTIT